VAYLNPFSRLATTDMGRKLGAVPFFLRGIWVPIYHNVAEAYLPVKFHLDSAVWTQYTNVTERQDRQTEETTVR